MNTKNTIIIAVAIVLGFLILGLCQRYDLVAPGGNSNIILIDRMTGRIWLKFQQPNSGPTNWKRID